MQRVALRVGSSLLTSLLVVSMLNSEAVAIENLFQDFDRCPSSHRLDALSGFTAYRTEQRDAVRVFWHAPDVPGWHLHGFTAHITEIVDGPGGSRKKETSPGASSVVFEDIGLAGDWMAQFAVIDRNCVINDIVYKEFRPTALDRPPSPEEVRLAAATPPTPDPTATPVPPAAAVQTIAVTGAVANVRTGPGLEHTVLAQVLRGNRLTAVGISADRQWLQVVQDGARRWILADLTDVAHDARAELPVQIVTPMRSASEAEIQTTTVTGAVVNVRAGPGLEHTVLARVRQGTTLRVTGASANRQWLQVELEGAVRWIYADLTDVAAAVRAGLPVPDPNVCQRHPVVQGALLTAVAGTSQEMRTCVSLTATELEAVTSLTLELGVGHIPLQTGDLAGLSHLTQLAITAPAGVVVLWSQDLLRNTPALQELRLEFYEARISSRYLQVLPHLAPIINTGAWERQDLSGERLRGLMAQLPALQFLTLDGVDMKTLPDRLLIHNGRLRRLAISNQHTVPAGSYGAFLDPEDLLRLPRDLLAYTPLLEELALTGITGPLPPGWLQPVPALRTLAVRGLMRPDSLPERLLASNPGLKALTMHLWDNPHRWKSYEDELPADLLAYTPQLQVLDLLSFQLKAVSADLLAPVPQLQQLRLRSPYHIALPQGLLRHSSNLREVYFHTGGAWPDLSHNPQLRKLEGTDPPKLGKDQLARLPLLQELHFRPADPLASLAFNPHLHTLTGGLDAAPGDWLVHSPQLRSLELYSRFAAEDRVQQRDLLASTPQLRSLRVRFGGAHGRLPADFLQPVPHLQSLEISGLQSPASLPERALTHVPQLRQFTLWAPSLRVFPEDFLQLNAQLQALTLELGDQEFLPSSFLHHTPQLQHFKLRSNAVTAIPADFLVQNPQLQTLALTLPKLEALPAGLLRNTLQLKRLSLNTYGWDGAYGFLLTLPADFLVYTPELQYLSLNLPNAVLPASLFRHLPHLRELRAGGTGTQVSLPADLLIRSPYLRCCF